jgi:hypothetical protein
MHPIDNYSTIQRGLEELRQEAERERLIRAARLQKLDHPVTLRRFVAWIGSHLARRHQKPEHIYTPRKTSNAVPASPHH